MLDNAPDCYVKNSSIHGLGLFAGKHFKKGDVVLNFGLFPEEWYTSLYCKLSEEKKKRSGYIMLDDSRCITTDKRTKFGYVNHSRTPNCDYDLKNRLLIANCNIKINSEITIDYRHEPLPKGESSPDWV
jgi:SET domain-containing protein